MKLNYEVFDLHWQERHLGDINKQLKNKLEAEGQGSFRAIQASWDSTALVGNTFSAQSSQSNTMDCEPTLQIGYHHYVPPEGATIARSVVGEGNFIQGWVL